MADQANDTGLGCLWLVALVLFVPAGFVTAAIWPDITANQFVGRTLLIGGACALALLALGSAAAITRHRS